jgi:hypothetical protein
MSQKKTLENLQKRALKMIFGWEKTYEELLIESGLPTLEQRRAERFTSFSKKVESSARFSKAWLVPNITETSTRRVNKYVPKRTKTVRQDKNPVNAIVKELNRIHRET